MVVPLLSDITMASDLNCIAGAMPEIKSLLWLLIPVSGPPNVIGPLILSIVWFIRPVKGISFPEI
jgi:hypothetical protein